MKQTRKQQPEHDYRRECVSGIFSIRIDPRIQREIPLVRRFAKNTCVYSTSLVKNAKTEDGARTMLARPCLTVRSKRRWPFNLCSLRLENGGLVARSLCMSFSPFGDASMRTLGKALAKAGIVVRMRDGRALPSTFEFDKTARNICKSVVSLFKAKDEFVVCQRLST